MFGLFEYRKKVATLEWRLEKLSSDYIDLAARFDKVECECVYQHEDSIYCFRLDGSPPKKEISVRQAIEAVVAHLGISIERKDKQTLVTAVKKPAPKKR